MNCVEFLEKEKIIYFSFIQSVKRWNRLSQKWYCFFSKKVQRL